MPAKDIFRSFRDKVEATSGWRIRAELPFGNEKFRDVRRALPDLHIRDILDVGANVGQSAMQFRKRIPKGCDAALNLLEAPWRSSRSTFTMPLSIFINWR